ncbi:hypothetical protein MRB53_042254 [Persea americana]|nr:hypothetical protein MRB53_042254 [Persea americana]
MYSPRCACRFVCTILLALHAIEEKRSAVYRRLRRDVTVSQDMLTLSWIVAKLTRIEIGKEIGSHGLAFLHFRMHDQVKRMTRVNQDEQHFLNAIGTLTASEIYAYAECMHLVLLTCSRNTTFVTQQYMRQSVVEAMERLWWWNSHLRVVFSDDGLLSIFEMSAESTFRMAFEI